jgi:hypothetical protein
MTQRLYFEREMVPGNFFVPGGRETAEENYFGRQSPLVSSKAG